VAAFSLKSEDRNPKSERNPKTEAGVALEPNFRPMIINLKFAWVRHSLLDVLLMAVLVLTLSVLGGAEPDVRRDAAVLAVERVMPSVVNIQTKTIVERRGFYDDLLREFYGSFYRRRPPDTQFSLGSGVIIDEEGYILTNLHVVQRANQMLVKLADERIYEAEPVGGAQTKDVALLRLRGKPGERYPAARLAADDDLLLGETVLALGIPFGLGGSVSRGILSSKTRRPPAENEPLDVADWLQTDAAINPGNSGGPLINLRGEIIGINVAVYREGQGIGFAIPIKRISEAIAGIFTPEEVAGLWFGARIKPGRLPLQVMTVQPGSPAARAGLKVGDLIQQVNGRVPRGLADCIHEIVKAGHQGAVSFQILRDHERRGLAVRLVSEASFFNAELIQQKIGANVQTLTAELAERLGLNTEVGVVVIGVTQGGPAAEAGLRRHFIVQGIDGQAVSDVIAAAKILHGKKKGDPAVLSVVVERRLGNWVETGTGTISVKVR
jgi:S1-C subfamily serine protease